APGLVLHQLLIAQLRKAGHGLSWLDVQQVSEHRPDWPRVCAALVIQRTSVLPWHRRRFQMRQYPRCPVAVDAVHARSTATIILRHIAPLRLVDGLITIRLHVACLLEGVPFSAIKFANPGSPDMDRRARQYSPCPVAVRYECA